MSRPSRDTPAGRAYLDLQNRARAEARGTQELLTLYVVERWLARLSPSPYARNHPRRKDHHCHRARSRQHTRARLRRLFPRPFLLGLRTVSGTVSTGPDAPSVAWRGRNSCGQTIEPVVAQIDQQQVAVELVGWRVPMGCN